MTQPNFILNLPKSSSPYTFPEAAGKITTGILNVIQDGIIYGTHSVVQTIDTHFPSFKEVTATFRKYSPRIINIVCYIGCFYNFWCARKVFIIVSAIGVALSTKIFPSRYFNILQQSALDSPSIKIGIFLSAAVNYYLDRTFLDDKFFATMTALFFGNVVWHYFSAQIIKYAVDLTQVLGLHWIAVKIQATTTDAPSKELNISTSQDEGSPNSR